MAAIHGAAQYFGGVHDPGMLQVEHAVVVLAFLVELAQQVFDTVDIGRAVADDDRVGAADGGQVTVGWHQRTNQWDEFASGAVLYLDQPGFKAVWRIAPSTGVRFGLGVGHDACLLALGHHAETVGGHHREKQLVDLRQRQRTVGHHIDLAFDPGIDHKRLAADLCHLIDKLADIRALEVNGPAFFLLAGARRHGRNGSAQWLRAAGQAGNQKGEGKAREGRGHRISCFP